MKPGESEEGLCSFGEDFKLEFRGGGILESNWKDWHAIQNAFDLVVNNFGDLVNQNNRPSRVPAKTPGSPLK